MTKNSCKTSNLDRTGENFGKYIISKGLTFRIDSEHIRIIKDTWNKKNLSNFTNVQFTGRSHDKSVYGKIINLSNNEGNTN